MARVSIIVLAAGASRRLGQPKQLLLVGKEPLLRRIVRLACETSATSVAVVLGSEAAACQNALTGLAVAVLVNPFWEKGMASSLRVGVAHAETLMSEGVLIVTVDQIALTADVLDQFIRKFRGEPDAVIAAKYGGVIGVPILFGSRWFEPLQLLTGDIGARVLARSARKIEFVEWPEGALDVDRPEDLQKIAVFGSEQTDS
jgi:molybdenum cofactor cytidylyltransferase